MSCTFIKQPKVRMERISTLWISFICLFALASPSRALAQDKGLPDLGLPTIDQQFAFPDDSGSSTAPQQQSDASSGPSKGFDQNELGGFEGFGFGSEFGGGFGGDFGAEKISYTASFEASRSGQAKVTVTASIGPGWHTYSVSQADGGPLPTRLKLTLNGQKLETGPIIASPEPEVTFDPVAYAADFPIEEHHDEVVWTLNASLPPGTAPETAEIQVQVDAQVCKQSCEMVSEKVVAKFAGFYEEASRSETLRLSDTQAEWSATISPAVVSPGDQATITLSAKVDKGYHVYQFLPEYVLDDDGLPDTNYRTLIVAKTKSGLKFGAPQADAPVHAMEGFEEAVYYEGSVNWEIPVLVPETAKAGELPIEILVAFLTCNDRSCSPPSGLSATTTVTVAEQSGKQSAKFMLAAAKFKDAEESPALLSWIDATDADGLAASNDSSQPAQALTLVHLAAALAGGFILNFMPCVLPVIGLKLMSFVNQAGNSHRKVVELNLAFSAGILSVMLTLALITVMAKVIWGTAFGWGEQFTVLEFKVALAALVFAMALSFLGVWEIPIPGFATSSTSGELMEKEGPFGAFAKGVLTTVLATPCSGPLLGSLFGLSLTLSPFSVIMLYMVVGLGMCIPYLALCLNPKFINLLPKPGAWMDTLKQVLAFPLLLTAVFFVASIDEGNRIATLILLIVVWFACWLIGRVPAYAEMPKKFTAWSAGIASIALGAFVSFGYFGPVNSELPWVPYSEAQLAKLRNDGKTVMVDFTANWCVNCQLNTRFAIERAGVAEIVAENDVVPMLADWTEPSDEIRAKLDELQSNSIPLMVIYPGDAVKEPIVLRDVLTEGQVIAALEEAGPSQDEATFTSTVN